MFINPDLVAVRLGHNSIADLSDIEKSVANSLIVAVEAVISKRFVSLRTTTYTEYLPATGRETVGSTYDMTSIDYENGLVIDRPSGNGTTVLQLTNTPVLLDGLVVREDINARGGQAAGAFGSSTQLTLGVDYYLDVDDGDSSQSGILRRVSGVWSNAPRSIKVTYKCGTQAFDSDDTAIITEAIVLAVVHNYRFWMRTKNVNPDGVLVSSENIGKYSYTSGGAGGSLGNEFGGFTVIIPDEVQAMLEGFFNWGNVL